MSDLQTIKEKFNLSENAIVYRCARNKTDLQALTDANQSIHTFSDSTGFYVVVSNEFTHPDYTRVE
jgi:hypothetical protein